MVYSRSKLPGSRCQTKTQQIWLNHQIRYISIYISLSFCQSYFNSTSWLCCEEYAIELLLDQELIGFYKLCQDFRSFAAVMQDVEPELCKWEWSLPQWKSFDVLHWSVHQTKASTKRSLRWWRYKLRTRLSSFTQCNTSACIKWLEAGIFPILLNFQGPGHADKSLSSRLLAEWSVMNMTSPWKRKRRWIPPKWALIRSLPLLPVEEFSSTVWAYGLQLLSGVYVSKQTWIEEKSLNSTTPCPIAHDF